MLEELDLILKKDPIIATYPVRYLISAPDEVEHMYRTHARTHIPLGDTTKYVDTIFKWVGGSNRGAFIGAVVGDYGHGKTSFQVHVWDRSQERKVFSVPPFRWEKVSDIIDGIDAWIQHVIGKTHTEVAAKAKDLHTSFTEKSLREQAQEIAKATEQNADGVYRTLRAAMDKFGDNEDILRATPEQFLDYCQGITGFLKEAGYSGLLVLLDEPEMTAKTLGMAKVSHILFDIADGLHLRNGDYGVFISMPENFLAQVQSMFSSLSARLQSRKCLPRLRDVYGTDFARLLWKRYVDEFHLGEDGLRVVSPEALQAIGQVASSDRSDLSYGPRTVVSVFARMVYCYREKNTTYSPEEFVKDCLEGEIQVSNYASRVREIIESPDAKEVDQGALITLAAFPNGMSSAMGKKLGIYEAILKLSRRSSLVYKRGDLFGLRGLQKEEVGIERDDLRDVIISIAEEFAPGLASLASAINAFTKYLIPALFEPRQGQQLLGWDIPGDWGKTQSHTRYAELTGAFRQTAREYPRRTVIVAAGPREADQQKVYPEIQPPDSSPDILIFFGIRWSKEDLMPEKRIEIDPGKPGGEPGTIRLVLNFADNSLSNEFLEGIIEKELLTPLGVLYLINEKDKRTLGREFEVEWQTRREQLLRGLLHRFFGDQAVRTQASEQIGQTITGDALALLGSVSRAILLARYPKYSTLITQPQWQKKVNEYVRALKNTDIPISCKRGHEPWIAPVDDVTRAFNTSLMNLKGGFFSGLDNLISIRSQERHGNLEVEFRLHPLEQALVERITLNNPLTKRKFDGVECWCVPFEDVKSMVLHSGYVLEELGHIVEIGRSRGTFEAGKYKDKRVLYCKPLDLGQMKSQLREKLVDLEREAEAFRELPDFRTSFDYDAVRKGIEEIQDEGYYDALRGKMNREFEKMHQMFPKYLERLARDIAEIGGDASDVKKQLLESLDIGTIRSAPKALSKWSADLNAYARISLKNMVHQVQKECSSIQTSADKALIEYDAKIHKGPLDKVSHLLRGWRCVGDLKGDLESETKPKASTALSYLRDYDKWTQLLSKSDEVYDTLMDLKNESAHEAKANGLISKLESIGHEISMHLKKNQLSGLGSHRQFHEQFKTLDEERRKYILELRSAFESKKRGMNELLQKVDAGQDYRCKETFNPDDIHGGYRRLYDEAAKHIRDAVSIERKDIVSQRQELLYAHYILSQLSQGKTQPLVVQLDDCTQSLDTILAKITADWTLQLMEGPQEERSQIKDAIQRSREATRSARIAIQQTEGTQEEKLSPDAEKVLKMIPARASENLKQLILGMMKSGGSTSDVLNASLDCVAELFRKGKIKVTIERHRR